MVIQQACENISEASIVLHPAGLHSQDVTLRDNTHCYLWLENKDEAANYIKQYRTVKNRSDVGGTKLIRCLLKWYRFIYFCRSHYFISWVKILRRSVICVSTFLVKRKDNGTQRTILFFPVVENDPHSISVIRYKSQATFGSEQGILGTHYWIIEHITGHPWNKQ